MWTDKGRLFSGLAKFLSGLSDINHLDRLSKSSLEHFSETINSRLLNFFNRGHQGGFLCMFHFKFNLRPWLSDLELVTHVGPLTCALKMHVLAVQIL